MPDTEPTADTLLSLIQSWQRGDTVRDDVARQLSRLSPEGGAVVVDLIRRLCPSGTQPGRTPSGASTDEWRSELLACRARTWRVPDVAGLLVGPGVLILTDGRQGAVLRERGIACLPASVSATTLLLCETIVMAHTALDQQELLKLQRQRVEATSTSMSELDRIP